MIRSALALLAALALTPAAAAGSSGAPEVEDAEGDCALPYGAGYLDITAAWIEQETPDAFVVALSLAAFDARVAEGAAYVVQFEHQGLRWGTLAMYRPLSDGGWTYFTAQVTMENAAPETFAPTDGSFDDLTLRLTFAKDIFPHVDPSDASLRGFVAATADLRTAYPFFLATDQVAAGSSDGKWLVCDEAASSATYEFALGQHAAADGGGAPGAAPSTSAAPASSAPPVADGADPAARAVPGGAWVLPVATLAAALCARRRGRG